MKGMWTKQLSNDGKIFFYNAHMNKSLWTPPSEAVIYEAPNLKTINQAREELVEIPVRVEENTLIDQPQQYYDSSQLTLDTNTYTSNASEPTVLRQSSISNDTKEIDNSALTDK